MAELKIVYWSGTGNTAIMADCIAKGAGAAGAEAKLIPVEETTPQELAAEKVFALGCPSMGDEVLEEMTMEPFVEELEKSVSGKKILLFGSYGWGDGQWMRDWTERMTAAGAQMIEMDGVIANGAPAGEDEEHCLSAGKLLGEAFKEA